MSFEEWSDEDLLFDFLVPEHNADSTREREKSRFFAIAQDDAGAISDYDTVSDGVRDSNIDATAHWYCAMTQ